MAAGRKIINVDIEPFLYSIKCEYKLNEPLSKHTTLCIGGAADCFVEVETCKQLISLLKFLRENKISFYVIGGGSNLLFDDEGFKGIIIKLSAKPNSEFVKIGRVEDWKIEKKEEQDIEHICCGAAVNLSYLAKQTAERSLSGLEHFVAIPGTIGGALFGNAGIKNKNISDMLKELEIVDYYGNKKNLSKKNINFEYRKSGLCDCVITKAVFVLKKADKNDILKTISQEFEKRKISQPFGAKSAGCIFKNPPNDTAGRIIDSLNLKSYGIGGIEISDKHANFFINKNNGRAKDMMNLIKFVKNRVNEKYNIKLETEIKIIK